jgi:pimeloyl-ACP methyl ester carboxylesterase
MINNGTVEILDGAQIYYKQYVGNKIPILMATGILSPMNDYIPLATELNRNGNEIVLVEHRGQGKSTLDKPLPPSIHPKDVTILQMATDLFDVILAFEWKEFIMIGFDTSAMVLMQLGILLNGRDDVLCKGMVLVSTAAMNPSRGLFMHSIQTPFVKTDFVEACLGRDWLKSNQYEYQHIHSSQLHVAGTIVIT